MNALIIEDEVLIAKELTHKIGLVADDIKVAAVLPSVKTANQWFLENAEPDIVFADIQLSDGASFEVLDRYQLQCPVVFTTAYDEYALKAFKVNGIDYLLKPVENTELKRAIDKARVIVESRSTYPKDLRQFMQIMAHPERLGAGYKERFVVKVRNNWVPIDTKDIACFYRDNFNYLLTFGGEKYMLDFVTLEEIEELLDPRLYFRANRQCLVHINAIQRITPHENQKLTLLLKTPLKMEQDVSREKAPVFKRWFER
jgi:DNA-binding LytR/AlgR family response regulator